MTPLPDRELRSRPRTCRPGAAAITATTSRSREFRPRAYSALAVVLFAAVFAAACGDDPSAPAISDTLVLELPAFEPLAGGFHYEGWAIIDGQPVSTGKFNVNGDGMLVMLDGQVIPDGAFSTGTDLSATEAVVITIEPAGDVDAVPSVTKYVGGGVSSGLANLTVGDSRAIGSDFTSAEGGFVLATPTAPDAPFYAGVWFLEVTDGGPVASLDLPELPEGWRYEGWAVIDGQPVTTGTFLMASGSDDAAPFSGPDPGPSYPGEDFVQNAPDGLSFPADLRGMTIVVSIEPYPDDSPAPFTLKPLAGTAPLDAEALTRYPLGNMAAAFPTGFAEIR